MELKRFEPVSYTAKKLISELVDRGGEIITVKREYVEILRQQSIAKVDQHGRVEWRPQ